MPLSQPFRLPRSFNRPTSLRTRALARRMYQRRSSLQRFRRSGHGVLRRAGKLCAAFLAELKLWGAILLGGGVVALAAVLLFSPVFDVKEIRIRRQDARIDVAEVQRSLAPLLKNRLLFITKNQVLKLLAAGNPAITRIEMSKHYPSQLSVTVFVDPVVAQVRLEQAGGEDTESGSTAGAESGTVLAKNQTRTDGSYLYVDEQGYLVSSPIRIATKPLPILTVTDWGVTPTDRTFLLSPDALGVIFRTRDLLRENYGLTPVKIIVYLRAQEFHIRTNNVTLWFDLASAPALQFQRFREFLATVSLEQVKEYIDLRISDRVIYK